MPTILIPDGESNHCSNVLYCLAELDDVRFIVLSNVKNAYVKYSKYCHEFIYERERKEEKDFIELLLRIIQNRKVDILFPIDTNGIFVVEKHKNELSKKCKLPLLPDNEIAKKVDNKKCFARMMEGGGFMVPNTIEFQSKKDLPFPILFKPALGSSGEGIFIAKTQSDILENKNNNTDYLVQEYIDGFDIDCSFLAIDGEVIVYTVQRKLGAKETDDYDFEPGKDIKIEKNVEISQIIKNLAKFLKWSGVAHVDLRYCNKRKAYLIIEINPRYWSSLLASKEAGVNFPIIAINAKASNSNDFLDIIYLSFKNGIKQKLRLGGSKKNSELKMSSSLKYVLMDPIPFLVVKTKKIFFKY